MLGVDPSRREPNTLTGVGAGIALVVVLTLVLLPFHTDLGRASPALALVVPVVVAGFFGGRLAAVVTAVCGGIAFSLAFIPPVGSLRVAVSEDVVALIVFTIVAISVGTLVALESDRRRAAEQRAVEIAADRLAVLERVDEQRAALMRSVSHDLRTPLASIRAVASDLRDGAVLSESVRQELLTLVCDETERLDRLVANLLSLSRIESGALQPDLQAVAVDELLVEVVRRLARLFDGVELEVRVPPGLPLVDIDYVLVDQVASNLLENAVRHAPPGSEVVVSALREGREVAVTVTDQGPGLDPTELKHIFEPFRTGLGSASTGVGLAICRAIVEAHGGMITADNNPGGGARFRFTLPVRDG
jgi:K+-sensing histidine kinase KdpD